jgi:hypothetical protein
MLRRLMHRQVPADASVAAVERFADRQNDRGERGPWSKTPSPSPLHPTSSHPNNRQRAEIPKVARNHWAFAPYQSIVHPEALRDSPVDADRGLSKPG